jgi:integrase
LSTFSRLTTSITGLIGDYARDWISVTVPATCKPSTESDYKGLLDNHIIPVLGKKQVNDIKRL